MLSWATHIQEVNGPDLGKIVEEGFIVYTKPGRGIDPDPGDRE